MQYDSTVFVSYTVPDHRDLEKSYDMVHLPSLKRNVTRAPFTNVILGAL